MKRIGIIGGGWLGMHIAQHLCSNYNIHTTTTSEDKNRRLIDMGYDSISIQFDDYEIKQDQKSWEILNSLDVIIITVPFSKRTEIDLLKNRFKNLSAFIDGFDRQLFLMSSIGVYPNSIKEIAEDTLNEEDLNPTILAIEKLMQKNFPQINILRLGGLLGGSRVLSNYKISMPQEPVNHIHYADIGLIIEKMIDIKSNCKTYNVVAPLHPSKQEIINYQKGIESDTNHSENGRRISSNLIIKDLKYTFKYPNPTTFK